MKTIEEAAKEFAKKYCLNDELHEKIFESGFIFGAKQFAQRWIPVEKELPENRVAVLVKLIDRNIPTVATLNINDMCWYFYDYSDNEWYGFAKVKEITHWRPIELE